MGRALAVLTILDSELSLSSALATEGVLDICKGRLRKSGCPKRRIAAMVCNKGKDSRYVSLCHFS